MACATLKRSLEWDPLNSSPSTSANANGRPAKKRCLNNLFISMPPKEPSPFGEVKPKLTAEYIANSIKEEMKRFNHRKQLHYSCIQSAANSSNNCDSTSNECSPINENTSPVANAIGLQSPARRDQPLFTFRQVNLICDRLLKERETHLRED